MRIAQWSSSQGPRPLVLIPADAGGSDRYLACGEGLRHGGCPRCPERHASMADIDPGSIVLSWTPGYLVYASVRAEPLEKTRMRR